MGPKTSGVFASKKRIVMSCFASDGGQDASKKFKKRKKAQWKRHKKVGGLEERKQEES